MASKRKRTNAQWAATKWVGHQLFDRRETFEAVDEGTVEKLRRRHGHRQAVPPSWAPTEVVTPYDNAGEWVVTVDDADAVSDGVWGL